MQRHKCYLKIVNKFILWSFNRCGGRIRRAWAAQVILHIHIYIHTHRTYELMHLHLHIFLWTQTVPGRFLSISTYRQLVWMAFVVFFISAPIELLLFGSRFCWNYANKIAGWCSLKHVHVLFVVMNGNGVLLLDDSVSFKATQKSFKNKRIQSKASKLFKFKLENLQCEFLFYLHIFAPWASEFK